MRTTLIIAALALSGCQLALPTPADVCDGPLRGVVAQAAGSTAAEMALACKAVRQK